MLNIQLYQLLLGLAQLVLRLGQLGLEPAPLVVGPHALLDLLLGRLRVVLQLGFERAQLEELAFLGQSLALGFGDLRLLCRELLGEQALLRLEHLEVLIGPQQLLVVVSRLLLGLESLGLALLDKLLQLFLGAEKHLNVGLLALQLALEPLGCHAHSLLVSL